MGSGSLQCKQDVCHEQKVEQDKDGSCWEQSSSAYPLFFHIVVIQMFLISSAWANKEVWDFLRGKAVTEADQQHGYAAVCSIAFKCPANFNLADLMSKAV